MLLWRVNLLYLHFLRDNGVLHNHRADRDVKYVLAVNRRRKFTQDRKRVKIPPALYSTIERVNKVSSLAIVKWYCISQLIEVMMATPCKSAVPLSPRELKYKRD